VRDLPANEDIVVVALVVVVVMVAGGVWLDRKEESVAVDGVVVVKEREAAQTGDDTAVLGVSGALECGECCECDCKKVESPSGTDDAVILVVASDDIVAVEGVVLDVRPVSSAVVDDAAVGVCMVRWDAVDTNEDSVVLPGVVDDVPIPLDSTP